MSLASPQSPDVRPGRRQGRAVRRAGGIARRWWGSGAGTPRSGDHDGSYTSPISWSRAVPASPSSPIAVLSAHIGLDGGCEGVEPDADLWAALAAVPDPRKARGRRHRLVTVLAIGVCAVLAGARSYVAIAEWAHDLPVSARLRLGLGRRAPSESTIRRILQAVDLDAVDATLSGWLADRSPDLPPGRMRVVAVDGKTARGARTDDGTQVHLLAAFDHGGGIVLGQTQVSGEGGKSSEITA